MLFPQISIYTVIWTEYDIVALYDNIYQLLKVCNCHNSKFVAFGHSIINMTVEHFYMGLEGMR